MRAARDCIQIHGGIGFTWDNDTQLWYKRAKSSEAFLGDAAHHRELLMRQWRDPETIRARHGRGIARARQR